MSRLLPLLLSLCALAGCREQPPSTPEAAYRAFASALRAGDRAAAYAALSEPTREAIEARATQIAEASKGMVKNDPAVMLFQSGTRPEPLGEVKVLEQHDTTAVLEVGGARVTMVRDTAGRWRVDLHDAFAARGAP